MIPCGSKTALQGQQVAIISYSWHENGAWTVGALSECTCEVGGLRKQKTITVGAGLRFDFFRFYLFLMRSAASGTRLWFAR